MTPIIVIEDQDDAYQTILGYVQDYAKEYRLPEGELHIERARTYEEWSKLLVEYRPQQLLLIVDIRLPRKDASEVVQVLLQRGDGSIPHSWPIIIYSVVFDNKLKRLNRENFVFIHKFEDPPDAPSPRIKLRSMIYQYLDVLRAKPASAR
jgi:hypothetical protein